MFDWLKKNQRYNMKKLDEDLMIVLPSTNKFIQSFSHYLFMKIGKKDMVFLNTSSEASGRIGNALEGIELACEEAVKFALAAEGIWPKKKHWWHFK